MIMNEDAVPRATVEWDHSPFPARTQNGGHVLASRAAEFCRKNAFEKKEREMSLAIA